MIICATDFSPAAEAAATIAAGIAARTGNEMIVLHVVGPRDGLPCDAPQRAVLRERLAAEAARLRAHGATTREELADGLADEVIAERAGQPGVRAVVLGALGYRSPARWLLGSVSERVAETCPAPLLAVRWRERLQQWALGSGTLRVLIAHDGTPRDDAVLRWTGWLEQVGPCERVLAYVYSPPEEHRRLNIPPPIDVTAPHPEIVRHHTEAFHARWKALGDITMPALCIEPGLGTPAYNLAQIAAREAADLVVVGTHQRQGLDRLWHGSVSHGVLRLAGVTVASVPRA